MSDPPGQFLLYTAADGAVRVEVFFKEESVWLTQRALAELFGVKVPAIAKHLANIFESGELSREATVSILETVRQEGARAVARQLEYYNLDAIITEFNTVEQMIIDAVCSLHQPSSQPFSQREKGLAFREDPPSGWGGSLGEEFKPSRWTYVASTALPRQPGEVMVEPWVREALIALNPEIAEQSDRADEVIYALRAILLSVQGDGLVRANENFMAWLRGEKTMPFGPNGEHVAVRLVDFTQPGKNRLTVVNQWTYQTGSVVKRFDVVFLVNGLPLVIGEAKTPTRSAVTWFDGAYQINEIYEKEIPAMFVPNVFSFATEGRLLRYGSIRMPIDLWGPWRDDDNQDEGELRHVRATVESLMRPGVVLDILQNFTLFATDKKHRRIKVICRYQQYSGANMIVEREVKQALRRSLRRFSLHTDQELFDKAYGYIRQYY